MVQTEPVTARPPLSSSTRYTPLFLGCDTATDPSSPTSTWRGAPRIRTSCRFRTPDARLYCSRRRTRTARATGIQPPVARPFRSESLPRLCVLLAGPSRHASSRRVAIPAPSSRRTGHAGPGAEFGHGNHIGTGGGDFLSDAGHAGCHRHAECPGKGLHGLPCCTAFLNDGVAPITIPLSQRPRQHGVPQPNLELPCRSGLWNPRSHEGRSKRNRRRVSTTGQPYAQRQPQTHVCQWVSCNLTRSQSRHLIPHPKH